MRSQRSAGRASEHRRLCRAADGVADRLAALDFPAAPCAEWLVRAGTAWVRGSPDRIAVTRRALAEAHGTGVVAFAPFIERRLGEALGGDEGHALVRRADAAARRSAAERPVHRRNAACMRSPHGESQEHDEDA